MRIGKKKQLQAYPFVLPAILFLFFLMIVPITQVIYYSFFNNFIVTKNPEFVGLIHYKAILGDPVFFKTIWNTVIFTFFSVVGQMLLGLLLSELLNRSFNSFLRTIFRILLILPWIFTAVVVCSNWQLILNPLGVFNYILKTFGFINRWVDWLGETKTAMITLIIVNWWRGYPFLMISFLAGLQSIPASIREAAKVDGCNGFQSYMNITIPYLKPVIASVGLLSAIWTFRLFPLVWLLTGGGPGRDTEVLATYTYREAFVNFQYSKASSVAVVLLLFTFLFTWVYLRSEENQA